MDSARRRFMQKITQVFGGLSVAGFSLGVYANKTKALPATALRPPGAIAEAEFTSACVRCGLCVRDCPYDILTLATLEEPIATGTPYFIARSGPCEMCEDIPCVKACPTGALDHSLIDIKNADMGLASFVGEETCYAVLGTACRACYVACPVKDEALTMEQVRSGRKRAFVPTVHSDACTGCGKCEHACITPEASIKVFPRAMLTKDTGVDIRSA